MREKLKALAELQKVDMEIAAVVKSADVYPKQLTELEKDLGTARSALEAERQKLLDIERQRRTMEQSIIDEKDKVKKWEQRLAEQRSSREYAALAREIDIAKKSNITMAEELVELGKSYATQREVLKSREQEFSGRQDQIGGQMTGLKERTESSKGQVKELEEKRASLATKVDKQLVSRYDQVRKKRMPALVPLVGGTCQGCNMNVPPQLYQTLRTTRGTDLCPYCHRIIFAAEALEDPAAKKG